MGPAAWAGHKFGWIMPDGEPIELAAWQRAVLSAWWEHRETTTTLLVSNVKKTGKTLVNSVLLCWRWLVLPSEHFSCGNDLAQASSRQFAAITKMVERHPLLHKHVKTRQRKLTFVPTGSTLEALEVDPTGRAGANHSTASHTETWGVISENAVRAFEELTTPPGRIHGLPALRVCDSYSGHIGESNTWHDLIDRGLSGERLAGDWPLFKSNGLLLFHAEGREAQEKSFRGTPTERERYYQDQKASLRSSTFSRLHLNLRTATESLFVDPAQWESLFNPDLLPLPAGSPREVFVGVDLAYSAAGDHAAVVGIYPRRDHRRVKVAFCNVWKSSDRVDDLEIGDVENLLLHIASQHRLGMVSFDPWQSVLLSQRLASMGLPVALCPQTFASRGPYDTMLWRWARDGVLELPDLPELRGAGLASAKEVGSGGTIFLKKLGRRKCDVLVAMSLAVHAMDQPRETVEIRQLPRVRIA